MRRIKLSAALLVLLLVGCSGKVDPWEDVNRVTYGFNDGLDKLILKPAKDVYVAVIPKPVRAGVTNAFDNLSTVNVVVNDLMQGRIADGFRGVGRFAVNTTVGIGGVFDPAAKWGMPPRQNDFGVTLAKWGVKPGPYVVVPILGPYTVRDLGIIPVRSLTYPLRWIDLSWEVETGITVADILNGRAEIDPQLKLRDRAAIDPYIFTRDAYLRMREQRIHGSTTRPSVEPGFYEEEEATPPTTRPSSSSVSP